MLNKTKADWGSNGTGDLQTIQAFFRTDGF